MPQCISIFKLSAGVIIELSNSLELNYICVDLQSRTKFS